MDINMLLGILGLLTGWMVFLETRLYRMNAALEKRIEEKNEINKVIQLALKEDIARLETKIDMLINLQITDRTLRSEPSGSHKKIQ